MRYKSKKAFTLIELLVVVAIIGLLAAITVLSVTGAKTKSRDAKAKSDISAVARAAAMSLASGNSIPDNYERSDDYVLGYPSCIAPFTAPTTDFAFFSNTLNMGYYMCKLNDDIVQSFKDDSGNSYLTTAPKHPDPSQDYLWISSVNNDKGDHAFNGNNFYIEGANLSGNNLFICAKLPEYSGCIQGSASFFSSWAPLRNSPYFMF